MRAEGGNRVEPAADAKVHGVARPEQIVEVDLRMLEVDGAVRRKRHLPEVGDRVAERSAGPHVPFGDEIGEGEAVEWSAMARWRSCRGGPRRRRSPRTRAAGWPSASPLLPRRSSAAARWCPASSNRCPCRGTGIHSGETPLRTASALDRWCGTSGNSWRTAGEDGNRVRRKSCGCEQRREAESGESLHAFSSRRRRLIGLRRAPDVPRENHSLIRARTAVPERSSYAKDLRAERLADSWNPAAFPMASLTLCRQPRPWLRKSGKRAARFARKCGRFAHSSRSAITRSHDRGVSA